ncbi:MAG: hypothetical protein Ta2A_15620 [Treponemataceae bacterium]|nr:MAG: hypothetical protein Ta2A_15620 [Treponemataceae bacterium]
MDTTDVTPIIIKIITQPESIVAGVFFVVMVVFLNYVAGYDKNVQLAKRKSKLKSKSKPKKEKKGPPPPTEQETEEN